MIKHTIIVLLILLSTPFVFSQGTSGEKNIVLMEIKSEIDPRTSRYVDLGLTFADENFADLVIIELDTYGGTVNDAKDIVERILDYETPVYVFINKDAASAGALISISCDSIYMSAGASIGAATVVTADGAAAPDKYQSYMRSTMRSTAETKGRDPKIAEAMVDESIEIEGVSEEGKVLTFSTREAIENGFCEAEVSSIEEILEMHSIDNYKIIEFSLGTSEKVIAFFLNPFISGLLILIIIGGLYFELQTPGIGFPLAASVIAVILYFVPYYLNGLAENWEILMFVVGVILIALEVFVIPGFGVAGVLGLVFTMGSLVLVMINNDFFDFSFVPGPELFIAISTIIAGLFGSFVLVFFGGLRLSNTAAFKRISLEDSQKSDEGYTTKHVSDDIVGKKGIAHTVLRPSGIIEVEGELYDAYTRGSYLNKGEEIIIISDEGTSLKVKKAEVDTES